MKQGRERAVPCTKCGRPTMNALRLCDNCGETHELHIEPQTSGEFHAQCSCGLAFAEEAAADRHADANGWCGYCWGSGADAVGGYQGVCQFCKGSGEADPLRGLPTAEFPNGRPSSTLPRNFTFYPGEAEGE